MYLDNVYPEGVYPRHIIKLYRVDDDGYLGAVYDFRDFIRVLTENSLMCDDIYGIYGDESKADVQVGKWCREYVDMQYRVQETANDISRQQYPPLPEDRVGGL